MEEVKNMKIVNNTSAEILFTVDPNAKNLDEEKSYIFILQLLKNYFHAIYHYTIFNGQ